MTYLDINQCFDEICREIPPNQLVCLKHIVVKDLKHKFFFNSEPPLQKFIYWKRVEDEPKHKNKLGVRLSVTSSIVAMRQATHLLKSL